MFTYLLYSGKQRDDYRTFYRDRIETVRMWRSMRSNQLDARQHLGPPFELRGLEQYQSGSVSAELNQQRAEYMEAVLRAAWERRRLLQQNAPVCDNMIRERVQPLSNLAVERAQYLAAQDAKEAWRKEEDNNRDNHDDVEQSPSKRKRCMSPPESPQSILDLPFVVDGSSSSSNICGDEQLLSEHDRKLKHLKQRLVHHMNNCNAQPDAPPTPMVRGRGTVRPQQGMLMSAPPTPMNGRRTVHSNHQELNMMGPSAPPTPMSRRGTVCPPHDMNNTSAPPTPMNGRHTVTTATMMSPGAPLTPMGSINRRCVITSHKKYPTTPSHLSSRRTTGMSNEDFDRYMSSAQQLLDQQHDHIRRRSMSSMSSPMGSLQQQQQQQQQLQQPQTTKATQQSHHDLLLRQDSLSMGLKHRHHHHHHPDQRRRTSMGPMVQQHLDGPSMHNQQFLLQQQQRQQQHNDMRHRAAVGSSNSIGMMQKQYEAMRRGSLGGLHDGIANLHFRSTSGNNHNEQQQQQQFSKPQMPFPVQQQQQQGQRGSSPMLMMATNNNTQQAQQLRWQPASDDEDGIVANFSSMRRDSIASQAQP